MLTNFTKRLLTRKLFTPLNYAFGGGGHHHEIDYHAVVTKNQKSGRDLLIEVTISTRTKWPAESPGSWLTSKEYKMSKK